MQIIIFSLLLAVTLLVAIWFHDIWYPPEGRAERKLWNRSPDRVEGGNKHNRQRVALLHSSPQGKETA